MLRFLVLAGLLLGFGLVTDTKAASVVPPSLSGDNVDLGKIGVGETRYVVGVLGNVSLPKGLAKVTNGVLDKFGIGPIPRSYTDEHDSFTFTAHGPEVKVHSFEWFNGIELGKWTLLNEVLDPTVAVNNQGPDPLGSSFAFSNVGGDDFTISFNGDAPHNSILAYKGKITVTPLPGAIFMLGAGLAGLGYLRHRTKSAAA